MAGTEVTAKPRTIVIAMDISKHSEHALKWYADLLYRPGDNLFMAYCAEPASSFPPMVGVPATKQVDIDPALGGDANEYADAVDATVQKLDKMAKACNLKLEHSILRLTGSPGQEILQAASDQKADFIVCGSRGQGLFRRTILGSVSDFLVHHSTIPVVVCKHEDEHPKIQVHKE